MRLDTIAYLIEWKWIHSILKYSHQMQDSRLYGALAIGTKSAAIGLTQLLLGERK